MAGVTPLEPAAVSQVWAAAPSAALDLPESGRVNVPALRQAALYGPQATAETPLSTQTNPLDFFRLQHSDRDATLPAEYFLRHDTAGHTTRFALQLPRFSPATGDFDALEHAATYVPADNGMDSPEVVSADRWQKVRRAVLDGAGAKAQLEKATKFSLGFRNATGEPDGPTTSEHLGGVDGPLPTQELPAVGTPRATGSKKQTAAAAKLASEQRAAAARLDGETEAAPAPALVVEASDTHKAGHTVLLSAVLAEWSAAEDRLLLHTQRDGGNATAAYAQAHLAAPLLYPKPVETGGAEEWGIPARLTELNSTLQRRAALLLQIPELDLPWLVQRSLVAHGGQALTPTTLQAAVGFEDASPQTATASPTPGVRKSRARAVSAGHALSPTISATVARGPSGSVAPNMKIRCVTREQAAALGLAAEEEGEAAPNTSEASVWLHTPGVTENDVLCHVDEVRAHAPFLTKLHDDTLSGLLLENHPPAPDEPLPVLLSENTRTFRRLKDMHRVFAADNVERVVHFCRNPGLIDKRFRLRAEAASALKTRTHQRQRMERAVRRRHRDRAALIREHYTKEESRIDQQLDAWLAADVAALKRLYGAHRVSELEKCRARRDAALRGAEQFYGAEAAVMGDVITKYSDALPETTDARSQRVVGEYRGVEQAVSELFPPSATVRLLLASELFVAPALETAMCRCIADDFSRHIDDPALRSPVLRSSTVAEILRQVELADLEALCQRCGVGAGNPAGDPEWLQAEGGITVGTVETELQRRGLEFKQDLAVKQLHEVEALAEQATQLNQRLASERKPESPKRLHNTPRRNELRLELAHGRGGVPDSSDEEDGELEVTRQMEAEHRLFSDYVFQELHSRMEDLAKVGGVDGETEDRHPDAATLLANALRPRDVTQLPHLHIGCHRCSDSGPASPGVVLHTAALLSPFTYVTVLGPASRGGIRRCGESSMRYRFDVHVTALGTALYPGTTLAVGVDVDDALTHPPLPSDTSASGRSLWGLGGDEWGDGAAAPDGEPLLSRGVLWLSTGLVYVRGQAHPLRNGTFDAGDTVGIGVDELTGTVHFLRNGAAIPSPTAGSSEVLKAALHSVGPLAPACVMYTPYPAQCEGAQRLKAGHRASHSSEDPHGVQIAFNFDGPFAGQPRPGMPVITTDRDAPRSLACDFPSYNTALARL